MNTAYPRNITQRINYITTEYFPNYIHYIILNYVYVRHQFKLQYYMDLKISSHSSLKLSISSHIAVMPKGDDGSDNITVKLECF